MTKVVFDISISLDGFITGPDQATERPLGRGGERLQAALEQAKAAAGDKTVAVGGGADCAWQFIRGGHLDEFSFHVVPILLGGGTRLFGELDEPMALEQIAVAETGQVSHLRYRVLDD